MMSRRRTGAIAIGVGAATAVVLSLMKVQKPVVIGSTAFAASLALIGLGSPLMTGCGAQTTIAEGGSNQAAESDSADRRALKDEIAELTKLIETNPQYALAYTNRGNAKGIGLGDDQGACADYKKAVSLGHQSTAQWLNSAGGAWCRNMR